MDQLAAMFGQLGSTIVQIVIPTTHATDEESSIATVSVGGNVDSKRIEKQSIEAFALV